MTLTRELTGDELTRIRAAAATGNYRVQQLVAFVPDVVVAQFQPSADPTDDIYADIEVGTVLSGSLSNLKTLQTVIYSTTTDYGATETYRTYVRKVDGTSVLYVGQNGWALSTAMVVTVLNSYDIHELPRTERGGVEYADWDKAFRRLLPVESSLPTAVVLTQGETAWTPTANPKALDKDATGSFTHAWESSNSNDVLNSGDTTASPDWTFQAASHRWIRYTFTDSNGNPNLRVMSIHTVPKDLATVVNLGFVDQGGNVADISHSLTDGWTCTLPAYKTIADIRKRTFCTVFSLEWYGDSFGSVISNIDFVGWLGDETIDTQGDERYGRISETRFVVDGIAARLAVTKVSPSAIRKTDSPSSWGDIEDPTPVRVIGFIATEHTTAFTLCAFSFPDTHTDFIGSEDIFVLNTNIVREAMQYTADAMKGLIQYNRDGRIDMATILVESDDTVRDAAETVVSMTPDDWLSYTIHVTPIRTCALLRCAAGLYNTTTNSWSLFRAYVPPLSDVEGTSNEDRPNIILTTDSSVGDALAELEDRSANLFASINPTDTIDIVFKDEWGFLQPDVGTWITFTVVLTDTVRGIAYSTSIRWQLVAFRYGCNTQTGRRQPSGTLRKETQNTGANTDVAAVVIDSENDVYTVPGVLPPFLGDLGFTDGEWFGSQSPQAPSYPFPANQGCENWGFRPKDGVGTQSDQNATTNQPIVVSIQGGSGVLQNGLNESDDFTASEQGWVPYSVGQAIRGSSLTASTCGVSASWSGSGWGSCDLRFGATFLRGAFVYLDLGSVRNITAVTMTYDLTKGTITNPSNHAANIAFVANPFSNDLPGVVASITYAVATNGTGKTLSFSGDETGRVVVLRCASSENASLYDGTARITSVTITTRTIYGDALYTWTSDDATPVAYDTDLGFLVENQQPSSIPPYSANHTYDIYTTASGAVLLDFASPVEQSDADNWSLLGEVCFL